jgi:hypothetical protein
MALEESALEPDESLIDTAVAPLAVDEIALLERLLREQLSGNPHRLDVLEAALKASESYKLEVLRSLYQSWVAIPQKARRQINRIAQSETPDVTDLRFQEKLHIWQEGALQNLAQDSGKDIPTIAEDLRKRWQAMQQHP